MQAFDRAFELVHHHNDMGMHPQGYGVNLYQAKKLKTTENERKGKRGSCLQSKQKWAPTAISFISKQSSAMVDKNTEGIGAIQRLYESFRNCLTRE